MKTHKVFISMPMRGLTTKEVLDQQAEYQKIIVNHLKDSNTNLVFLSNVFEDYAEMTPLQCFARSVATMSEADTVVFAGRWELARGCSLEQSIAFQYGLSTAFIKDDKFFSWKDYLKACSQDPGEVNA